MSKRLKEVLANRLHISFLETIENDPCDFSGTLRITVKEQAKDGTPWAQGMTRHVKVGHSQSECACYEIPIDPETGEGSIVIKGIEAVQFSVVQVDENVRQMVDGDDYAITYFVDGEASDMDYANFVFDETSTEPREVVIINRRIPCTCLRIKKRVEDMDGVACAIDPAALFTIRIVDMRGCERFVELCEENQFCEELCDLRSGRYFIEELPQRGYAPSYAFNGCANVDNLFDLEPGNNLLEIINEKVDATALTIEKYVRGRNGELCRPMRMEEFLVRIIGWNQDRVIALNEENGYCVTLFDLEPGYYDVSEISENACYDVSYIVNGRKECSYANLELNSCEEACIAIINTDPNDIPCMLQESPLRICKFIRRCDGCIMRPDNNDSFKVMLSGCGRNDTFLLNANNNFCVDVADLCDGCYEVSECASGDYMTTYSVNEGPERTSACIDIINGCCNSVAIINEERNRGSVSICQYVRMPNGDLGKPNKDACFHVTLSSYFCKRDIELNAENDWCMCFSDLRFGGYEVRACDDGEAQINYQVNGERERSYARFMIDDCCDNEIKIINSQRAVNSGILKICKYEETDCQELVKPSQDEEFCVSVSGPCFDELYTLRASNNWCILLEGLQPGEYRICESECENYDVSYQVNREPMEDAFVYLGTCNQEVLVINHRKRSGLLKLYALVRDCDGSTRLPQPREMFDILIEGVNDCQHTTLKASNGWCVVLDSLQEGNYRIIQTDTLGYKVSYQINGQESSFAKIALGQEDIAVGIINQVRDCTGIVTVTKYMEQEDGSLDMPCPQDDFTFELKGRGFSHTYHLNERNDFCVYFDDLEEGRYCVKELDTHCDVHYRINGNLVNAADFTLGNEDVDIDIINSPRSSGMVCIEKRLRCADTILMPDPDACYRILLKGKNCHDIYELHHDNDFCVCIENLAKQHYEVIELGHNCQLFDINGTLQENGYFLYDGEEKHITLINEERFTGSMEITKQIEDEDGVLRRPQRWECFDIMIESADYKQKVTLSYENDFNVRLYDLPRGHYEVSECQGGCVSYLVNDLPCESAIVDLCEQDVCICVINHPGQQGCIEFQGCVEEEGTLMMPKAQDEFHLIISNKETKQTLDLTCNNDFCDCLCHLTPGSYTVTESGSAPVRFEIEGQVFEDVVCIELNGEHVCVNVVRTMEHKPTITITKCMQDSKGIITKPEAQEQFQVTLLHNGRKQMFELNADNDWTKQLCDSPCGAYEIKEVEGGQGVRYQINMECPVESGYFEVQQEDVQVRVLNARPCMAMLHLEARIMDCDEELITPDEDMLFHVMLRNAEQQETTYVLSNKNQWRRDLELPMGEYRIEQQAVADFEGVQYLIDGSQEASVCLQLGEDERAVTCVNVMRCARGTLEISKVIRDANCGCFKRPDADGEYEVEVSGPQYHQILTLSSKNKWKEHLENLTQGCYQITELHAMQAVSYIVNGDECCEATLNIENNANTVKIVNEQTVLHGSIEICKLLQDEEGCYRYPEKDAMYWILIKGEQGTSRVLLNHANHFYASIRNLADGWYEICEETAGNAVVYVVNNASPQPQAQVHVQGNANTVNVINPHPVRKGSIQLSKYMQNGDLLLKPTAGEFEVLIRGAGEEKTFVLNRENGFREQVDNLASGTYEIKELQGQHVSYIINRTQHVDEAVVKVNGDVVDVQVINQEHNEKGSITLAKYIRSNGELMRPQGNASYVFHVSKPNYNELVTLDERNGWMYTLKDLEDGCYVIAETTTTDRVSYIINGGSECDYAVVDVHGASNTVQIINSRKQSGGSILLDKFIRINHALVKPSGNFTIRMHVSKPGYNEIFELNRSNNWMMRIDGLTNGVYVVDELDAADEVSYVINGGSEVARAIVTVQNNVNTVNIIDATAHEAGSIRIEKYIRNTMTNELELPPADFTMRVHVSKPGYNEVFTLNEANHFSITLRNLMDGSYVIDEVDTSDEVSFIINGGSEVCHAVVDVHGNRNLVEMINTRTTMLGSMTITKVVRNEMGQLMPPKDHERFDVTVSSVDFERRFVLAKDNNWQAHVSDMPSGHYEVVEQEISGYRVSYIVDDGRESKEASLHVDGDTHTVKVLNTRTSTLSTLEITKFIKQANGTLVRPADGDEYVVEVSNASYQQQLHLNNGNAFTYTLKDLSEGIYNIKEVDQDMFRVTYRVNGGTETDSATVTMTPGSRHVVEVINERKDNQNTIEVFKYMLDREGNYLPPESGQVFRFELLGEGIRDTYELNEANSWHRSLTQYPSGIYQIREVGSPFQVQYLVNSAELQPEARFEAVPQRTNIIGIINLLPGVQNGVMTLTKRMRQRNGDLILPNETESFIVRVTNGTYDENYTLDKDNGFTMRLEDLPYGTFTVEETSGAYAVSYIVDTGRESNSAQVTINSAMEHTVTIINTRSDLFFNVSSGNDDLRIVIQ